MRKLVRCLLFGGVVAGTLMASPSKARAQFPIAVAPVQSAVPAVVGYAPERRGLFGWRVVYRPVVAPVAVAPVAAAPIVAAPFTPTVSVGRPIIADPGLYGYGPAVAPVTSYFAPPMPIVVPAPITTFRYPFPAVVPYVGY